MSWRIPAYVYFSPWGSQAHCALGWNGEAFCGVSGGYQGEYTSLARGRVLGTPHLHEEEFQVLLDMILQEGNLAISYVISSGEARVKGTGLCALRHAGTEQQG